MGEGSYEDKHHGKAISVGRGSPEDNPETGMKSGGGLDTQVIRSWNGTMTTLHKLRSGIISEREKVVIIVSSCWSQTLIQVHQF